MDRAASRIGSSSVLKVLFGAGLFVWLAICAKLLTAEVAHPKTLQIAIAAAVLVAPIVILKIARVPVYLLAIYAALVPFDELLTTGIGASLTKVLAILVGGSLVLSMLAMRRATPPSRSLVIWAVMTAYIGATSFWAIDPAQAMAAYGPFFEYFVLLVAMWMYPISRRDMALVLLCTIAGALAAAAYGDYLFHSNPGMSDSRLMIGQNDTIIDSNEFASGLLMPIALTIVLFLRSRVGAAKVVWGAAAVTLFTGFIVSGSRGATIGLAAVGVFLLVRSQYRKQLMVILGAALISILASPVGQRFTQSDVSSGDGRVGIWKVGIASLHQYWLSGAGIGNFDLAYMHYFLSTPHQPLPWLRAAHSIFVQSAVEYGVIGFILTMAIWFLAMRELQYVRGDSLVNDICVALSAGVAGLFVAGFSLDLMIYKYTWLVFALIGLMRSMLITTGISVSAPPPPSDDESTVTLRPALTNIQAGS